MDSDKIDEKIEIIDFSGEKFHNLSVPCPLVLLLVIVLAIINGILLVMYPRSFGTTLISLFIILVLVLSYYNIAVKNPGKLRKFSISDNGIEIKVPQHPLFSVKWSEFEKIEIRLKKFDLKPYYAYQFYFITDDSENKFNLSLADFHKEKIQNILKILKDFAVQKGKEFFSFRETESSGVFFADDLNVK